jgi:hypothetical protein
MALRTKPTVILLKVDVDLASRKLDHSFVPVPGRPRERRLTEPVFRVTLVRREQPVELGFVSVLRVNVNLARREQLFDRGFVPVPGRPREWRLTVLVLRIDVGLASLTAISKSNLLLVHTRLGQSILAHYISKIILCLTSAQFCSA